MPSPAPLPPEGAFTNLYAELTPQCWRNFYPHPSIILSVCCDKPENVLPVRVTLAPAEESTSDYWAWWDAKDLRFHFVYYNRVQTEMCFPYGTTAATAHGDGHLVRVRVKVRLKPACEDCVMCRGEECNLCLSLMKSPPPCDHDSLTRHALWPNELKPKKKKNKGVDQ